MTLSVSTSFPCSRMWSSASRAVHSGRTETYFGVMKRPALPSGYPRSCRAIFSWSGLSVLSARFVTSAGSSSKRRVRSSGAIPLNTPAIWPVPSASTTSVC